LPTLDDLENLKAIFSDANLFASVWLRVHEMQHDAREQTLASISWEGHRGHHRLTWDPLDRSERSRYAM